MDSFRRGPEEETLRSFCLESLCLKSSQSKFFMKLQFKRMTLASMGFFLMVSVWALTGGKPFEHPRLNPFLEELLQKIETFHQNKQEERVYVQTDKPFYKPGETIWFSAYMRDAADFKSSDMSDVLRVELLNPKGTIEQEYQLQVSEGATKGDFFIPKEAAGGLYKLKVYTNWQKNDPRPAIFEKELQVQAVVLPRLKMKLDFEREAYGAGAEVKAELDLHTNENKPLAHHEFNFVVSLNGEMLIQNLDRSDQSGKANITFQLPEELETNDGLLNVMINYQGQTESISRSVPIVLNQVFMSFYPEGGDMVHGLPGRIAFKALNEFGKPADVEGIVLDEDGKEVASFSSYHMGMGAIDLIPARWQSYSVKLTEPAGVEEIFPLPEALPRGFSLSVRDVDENDITLQIHSTETETLSLVGMVRGEVYYATEIQVNPSGRQLRIPASEFPIGVAQFTLFDEKGIERCERLAFVNRHKHLNIDIRTNKERYLPREEVELSIRVSDEKGVPMPADLSLSVTDDQLLSFADDKSSNILSWMLVESDLRGKIEEPNFYFDPEEEKAGMALDYLLMTAGWRRFSWQQIQNQEALPQQYAADQTRIKGTVADWHGNMVKGATVRADGYTTTTDQQGRYEFKNIALNGRNIPVSVIHPDLGSHSVNVNAYGDRYHLRLRKINTVVGVVRGEDGEPLPGATVLIPENNQGVMTDMDGRFQLNVQDGQSLTFSYLGYTSVHHSVGQNRELEVQLAPDQVHLDEVVISGSGIRRKRQATGSVSKVVPKQLNAMPVDQLQGAVAGVDSGRARQKNKKAHRKPRRTQANAPIPVQPEPVPEMVELDNERDEEFADIVMDDMPNIPEPVPMEEIQVVPPPPAEKLEKGPKNDLAREEIEELKEAPAIGLDDKDVVEPMFFDAEILEEERVLKEDMEPEVNEFLFVDEEPTLLNIRDIRQQIGYPKVARDAGIEGTVVVRVLVDKKGNYKRHRVVKTPHPLLNKAVENQIHNLRFTPAIQGSAPADFWVNVPFKFGLEEPIPSSNMPVNQVVNRSGNGNKATVYYRAREFSVPNYKGQSVPATRNDFRSTIYWNGHVKVGRNGKAKVKFYTSDALTSFNVTAEGIGMDGSIGRGEYKFFSQLPFALSTKIPTSLVQFDTLLLPITLANNTDAPQYGQMSYAIPGGLIPLEKLPSRVELPTGKALTLFVPFLVNAAKGIGKLRIGFKSRGLSDGVEEELNFAPKGFPVSKAYSSEETTASFDADLTHAVHGSMNISLTAFPDVSGEILSGLEGMLREPYGCFEQTSSSTYPNLLVLDYLESTEQDNPNIRKKAHQLIQKGYNRLITFESSGGGFEWFGGNPAHEGLTAYGLMEFVDMKKVYSGVDQNMIDRTAKWLLSRRDGQGGFQRNPRALHQFGLADQATMSLYITWALTEAGYTGLDKELDYAFKMSRQTRNPYQLGLAANALFNYGRKGEAMACLQVLEMKRSEATGQFPYQTVGRSAPGSGGLALGIETSSLILLAMMKADHPARQEINELAKTIRNSRNAYGAFGSTNSTVLALRALIRHAEFAKQTETSGVIEVLADGHTIIEQSYDAGRTEPIVIRGLEQGLDAGPHRFEVRFNGVKQPLPYVLAANWYSSLPQSQEMCAVDLETSLAQAFAQQGETVRLTAELRNKTTGGLPMTMAILGIPAGLSAQPWQLKEMKEKGILDFYEVLDNELVCYFRQMKPSEEKVLNFDLKADLPGSYAAPASRAYLYYTDEFKTWNQPLEVSVSD